MKFSWEWIQDHIKLDITATEAADLISLRGLTVDEVVQVEDDYVLDIDITTNRPDAMNVRGIARELSAITSVGLESIDLNYHEQTKRVQEFASIAIEDTEGCHRFCARVITNATNGPSPAWMRRRLERVGMRSINLLVDITNYVLWELGHPLHGYDLDLVPGGKLIARRARNEEKLSLIDGTVRDLDNSMLAIADVDRAVGLGGIMGGTDTEMNENTRNILLECAYFEPTIVRKTARKLGLNTEASYRFERGMDYDDIPVAIDRCCNLYQQLAEADICKEMIDEYPTHRNPVTLTMRHDRLCSFAGLNISREKVAAIFSALDLAATYRDNIWKVSVPSRRVDISREADLFEEIIRIVGYDAIPATVPHVQQIPIGRDHLHKLINIADSALLASGYSEVINYDFIDPDDNRRFVPEGAGAPIKVLNPIATPQMSIMRQSLAPSLLQNMRHNISYGNTGVRIFEIARVFFDSEEGPIERTTIALAADGGEPEASWHSNVDSVDIFEFKGVIEYLFTRLGLSDIISDTGTIGFLAPGLSAEIFRTGNSGRQPIGWFGRVSQEIQEVYDFPNPVFLGQFDLDSVADICRIGQSYSRMSSYPRVSRDLSFSLPEGTGGKKIDFRTIYETIVGTGVEEITDVKLIDLYSGEETGGRTSMTIRVVYQTLDRTLVQDEIERFHARVRDNLAQLGVQFR